MTLGAYDPEYFQVVDEARLWLLIFFFLLLYIVSLLFNSLKCYTCDTFSADINSLVLSSHFRCRSNSHFILIILHFVFFLSLSFSSL